jgi:hypothetical protein
VTSNGSPDDPEDHPGDHPEDDPGADETQYANYGGAGTAAYSESYDQSPAPQPRAWYHNPAALVGLGVLTVAVLALFIYAVVDLTTAEKSRPIVTTVTSTATPPSPTVAPPAATTSVPTTAESTVPQETIVEQPAPTITVSPAAPTVTETIERRFPRLPNRVPPPLYEPLPGQ